MHVSGHYERKDFGRCIPAQRLICNSPYANPVDIDTTLIKRVIKTNN